MQNLKRFIAYFVYIILVGYLIVWANTYKKTLITKENSMIFVFISLLPVIIGLLLALPQFYVIIRKLGVWTFDWIKFIAIGVPSFLATANWLLWSIPFFHKYMFFLFNNSFLSTTGGIIFGYILLTSFKKVSPSSSTFTEANDGVSLK